MTEVKPKVHADIDQLGPWLEAARMAKEEMTKWKEVYDRARGHIEEALGDAEEGRVGGAPVVSWSWSNPATYLDDKALRADHPDLAEQYSKTKKPARSFKLLEKK